jgi:hypothetical protein
MEGPHSGLDAMILDMAAKDGVLEPRIYGYSSLREGTHVYFVCGEGGRVERYGVNLREGDEGYDPDFAAKVREMEEDDEHSSI